MPISDMIERLAVRKDENIAFTVPRFELVAFPARFIARYPEMKIWQDDYQRMLETWRGKVESNLKEQLGALKSGK